MRETFVLPERPDAAAAPRAPRSLREEIVAQLAEVRSWGGRFVIPVPEVAVL